VEVIAFEVWDFVSMNQWAGNEREEFHNSAYYSSSFFTYNCELLKLRVHNCYWNTERKNFEVKQRNESSKSFRIVTSQKRTQQQPSVKVRWNCWNIVDDNISKVSRKFVNIEISNRTASQKWKEKSKRTSLFLFNLK
jgi:hypothetical protein